MIDRAPVPSFVARQSQPLDRPRLSLGSLFALLVASLLVGLLLAVGLIAVREVGR